ncbi:winged helix-turn-helix transcriptional regulator [Paenibacillus gallinarum]|uniref:winged helix-turn-helix transcriptional regulator n=1 Tax=Paenibacillus gallinarum TaxID=2762232 RepID=UPI00177EA9CD|nr:winged helix-turn-helix transcriptional regulator [Paenibacillus gallinarum]
MISNETGYTKYDIYNAMNLLIKYKLIKVHNVSRWDRFLSEKQIPDKQVLEIQLLSISDDNKIGTFNSELFQYYLDIGLNIKHFMIHKLLLKDNKLTIEDIAGKTGLDGDAVFKHIRQMNRKYVLYSEYVRGSKYSNYKFKHRLLKSVRNTEQFMDKYKEATDINIARWDRKKIMNNDST